MHNMKIFINIMYGKIATTILMLILIFVEPSSQVYGGTEAQNASYPYAVNILKIYKSVQVCTGSILTATAVLAELNCFPQPVSAYASTFHIQYNILSNIAIGISSIIPSSNFIKSKPFENNLAILKLASPITFGPNAQPVVLPSQAIGSGPLVVGGYGLSKAKNSDGRLHYYSVTVATGDSCNKPGVIYNSVQTFCGTNTRNQVGECSGDNGAPAILNGVQYGVYLGASKGCVNQGSIPYYADVYYFLNWINSNI